MKKLINVLLVLLCLYAAFGFAGENKDLRSLDDRDYILDLWLHIGLRPERIIGGDLAQDNLNDIEVREIVKATQNIYPGAIVTIDGVQDKCPCEDGPKCKAQVWVVVYQSQESNGLMLSKIDNQWVIGPVQQWWLDLDAIGNQMDRINNKREPYSEDTSRKINLLKLKRNELWKNYPKCFDGNN